MRSTGGCLHTSVQLPLTLRQINSTAFSSSSLFLSLLVLFVSLQGIEIGLALLPEFGPVVCKFGPDALKPVLEATIASLLTQTTEQLARLPALADAMANVDPAILGVSLGGVIVHVGHVV